ncbi:MAG TPA: MBL fold metallo-hydrolase [Vicinamibacteria bacterium]|nr:MBL fold metallo-hydrolase [Vicinamibacteria bacterium]
MSRWMGGIVLVLAACVPAFGAGSQVGEVQRLAPDVYFYEGDIDKGHCNNGWVVFEDYVLVIDANYPSGAREIIPKIRELTDKPIRFAFDTHHHGDHAYGNQVWVDEGATPVAHTGVVEEMKKYETGHYGGKPGRWEEDAREREDVRGSRLKPPSVLFPDTLIFDDGTRRVELRHFGVGHTHGDGFAWLPKERILFTGDATVNGPYNYVGDGDMGAWIDTLERARSLGVRVVGPGHGPLGDDSTIQDQQTFFRELRLVVREASAGKSPADVQASIESMRTELVKNARIARYVGKDLPAQVAKAYNELTGKTLPDRRAEVEAERTHSSWHGVGSSGRR